MEDPYSETCTVNLKWGKQVFKDVSVPLTGGFVLFQAQIYSLTSVPPDRQKLLFKGRLLKELDSNLLKDGDTLLLIGISDEKKKPEGEAEEEAANKEVEEPKPIVEKQETSLPVILINLGNTCFLNATVQFLRCIPELRQSLRTYNGGNGGVCSTEDSQSLYAVSMTLALKALFKVLDDIPADRCYSPTNLLRVLQMVAPSFAVKDKNGSLQQQDANECWALFIRMMQSKLPPLNDDSKLHSSFIDQFMGGKFIVESKCLESEEPVTTVEEKFLQLSCFISQEVKFLVSGLRLSLQEELVKYSDVLKRDAKYSRNYKISRLPAYLTVHFMRFYFKEKVNMNTKILREVKFPLMFDAYEFCTDELKEKLGEMREKFRVDEETLEEKVKRSFPLPGQTVEMEDHHPFSFEDDTGSNNSGYYELKAVITHKGRTAQAGHYISWVKLPHLVNGWAKIDDESRSADIVEEDILRLAGGSDVHTAYMLLYGPRLLKRRDPDKKAAEEKKTAA